jgi:CubicO group peptidase (beta-lactamase class C family)
MKRSRLFSVLLWVVSLLAATAQAQTFPGEAWEHFGKPEDAGFSTAKLEEASAFGDEIQTAALTLVVDGKIVYEWGEVKRELRTHSIRKSVLSAMYGNYVKAGTIELDKTLAELGINDVPPLTEAELQATVRDVLKARSGIYHPALYSVDGYGYMWWVARDHNRFPHFQNVELPEGTYSARGSGGHVLLVIPEYGMVIVHRADTDAEGKRIPYETVGSLVNMLLSARN